MLYTAVNCNLHNFTLLPRQCKVKEEVKKNKVILVAKYTIQMP